jgi:DNA-binding phage protein
MTKAVSVPFSDVVQSRVQRDPDYAAALLAEAMQCFSRGETSIARAHVRDVIKGTIGYTELARLTGTPETSLVRMFGPSGNPTFSNVSNVISHLLQITGTELQVKLVSIPRRSTERRADAVSRRPRKSGSSARRHSI